MTLAIDRACDAESAGSQLEWVFCRSFLAIGSRFKRAANYKRARADAAAASAAAAAESAKQQQQEELRREQKEQCTLRATETNLQRKTTEWMSANRVANVKDLLLLLDILNGKDDIAVSDLLALRKLKAQQDEKAKAEERAHAQAARATAVQTVHEVRYITVQDDGNPAAAQSTYTAALQLRPSTFGH